MLANLCINKGIKPRYTHPYNRGTRGVYAMVMKPLTPCWKSRRNQGTRPPQEECPRRERLDDRTRRRSYIISWGIGHGYTGSEPEEEVD